MEVGQVNRPPSHRTFQLGGVTLSSDFDSGNLSYAQKATSTSYNIWIGTDHPENNYRTWFYFSVQGLSKNSSVTFNVKNMHNQTRLLSEGLVPVFRNGDDNKWKRIIHKINTASMFFNSDGFLEFSFKHTFQTDDKTYIAFFYPWSLEDNDRLLNQLQEQAKELQNVYFHKTTLINSYENRPIQLVTISSMSRIGKHDETLEDKLLFPRGNRPRTFHPDKKGIFISARVHPGQVPSSHVMNGILKGLLRQTEIASLLRDKFVFYLVPIINPDGVYRGHYRTDKNGVNLNRFYINPNPKEHPPIYAIKKWILHLHSIKRFFACLDMHAHASRKGAFIYGNYSTELKKQLDICLFPKILSLNSKNFEYEASNFTQKNMYCKDRADPISKEGAARVALFKITKNPYCWTLQCNYNMGKVENQINDRNFEKLPPVPDEPFNKDLLINYQNLNAIEPKTFYTIQTYESLGDEILESFLDLIEVHPHSRINNPQSRFGSFNNLKMNLLIALMKMTPYHFESCYRKLLLAITSQRDQLLMRGIKAIHEIFIKSKTIENLEEFLKNDQPVKPSKAPTARLPSIKKIPNLQRRRTYQEIIPIETGEPYVENKESEDFPSDIISSSNQTVENSINSSNCNIRVSRRQTPLVRSVDKQQCQIKTRLREYIEKVSISQHIEQVTSLQQMPTLKVVTLNMMKKVRVQETIDMGGSRAPVRSLLFTKKGRELSSGLRRQGRLIAEMAAQEE